MKLISLWLFPTTAMGNWYRNHLFLFLLHIKRWWEWKVSKIFPDLSCLMNMPTVVNWEGSSLFFFSCGNINQYKLTVTGCSYSDVHFTMHCTWILLGVLRLVNLQTNTFDLMPHSPLKRITDYISGCDLFKGF